MRRTAVVNRCGAIAVLTLVAGCASLGGGSPVGQLVAAPVVAARCQQDARAWLVGLDAEQRKKAQWPFDEKLRKTWLFVNNNSAVYVRKEGLAFADMTDAQRIAGHALIACALSSQGYGKAAGVMRVSDIHRGLNDPTLNALRENRPGMPSVQIGATWYWLAIFGEPSATEPWQVQLEGHHLVLNFTFVGNEISVTPTMFGARPATVESGPYSGWNVLTFEKKRGLDLLDALTTEQRRLAVIGATIPEDIFTSPLRNEAIDGYQGVAGGDLDAAQQSLLWQLVEEFVRNHDPEVAEQKLATIRRDGVEKLYFAVMGPTAEGAMYYRVHGPAVLIEFDNSLNRGENVPDPNHVHSILWYPGTDMGDDLLRRHYESGEHDHAH
ncbi:MAG: DUF3500 domain-containing protein [Gammaproteobacteria bacterium]|nr:DUF3500 domain-containing protein [Gammaproteobacteria bacterium]MDH5274818.1 DUF3500 domain-containing protein [Gammaproteobacteria bacterium]